MRLPIARISKEFFKTDYAGAKGPGWGIVPALNRCGKARLIADDLVGLPAPLEAGLYWIAQEALNNTLKHSGANSALVRLIAGSGSVSLEIRDNGRGFEAIEKYDQGGMGLASIRERVEQLDGSLKVFTSFGEGTINRPDRLDGGFS